MLRVDMYAEIKLLSENNKMKVDLAVFPSCLSLPGANNNTSYYAG